jgi:nucleoid DNA-binding protein
MKSVLNILETQCKNGAKIEFSKFGFFLSVTELHRRRRKVWRNKAEFIF